MTRGRRICRGLFFFFEVVGFLSGLILAFGPRGNRVTVDYNIALEVVVLFSVVVIGVTAFLLRKTDRRLAEVGLVTVIVLIMMGMAAPAW